jgi:hypothetical protein
MISASQFSLFFLWHMKEAGMCAISVGIPFTLFGVHTSIQETPSLIHHLNHSE